MRKGGRGSRPAAAPIEYFRGQGASPHASEEQPSKHSDKCPLITAGHQCFSWAQSSYHARLLRYLCRRWLAQRRPLAPSVAGGGPSVRRGRSEDALPLRRRQEIAFRRRTIFQAVTAADAPN